MLLVALSHGPAAAPDVRVSKQGHRDRLPDKLFSPLCASIERKTPRVERELNFFLSCSAMDGIRIQLQSGVVKVCSRKFFFERGRRRRLAGGE